MLARDQVSAHKLLGRFKKKLRWKIDWKIATVMYSYVAN